MFARFDENAAMTLRVIKETKRYRRTDGRTDARTHGRTDGHRENSIPPTNKVCGGYKNSQQRCDLPASENDRVILPIREDFIFMKLHICEVSRKYNPRENFQIYSNQRK